MLNEVTVYCAGGVVALMEVTHAIDILWDGTVDHLDQRMVRISVTVMVLVDKVAYLGVVSTPDII